MEKASNLPNTKKSSHWIIRFFQSISENISGLIAIPLLIGLYISGPAIVQTYNSYSAELSDKQNIINHNDQGIVLLDRYNQPFFVFYQPKQKIFIPLSNIPKEVRQAVIASEDKDFYFHPGFSVNAIFRSISDDLEKRSLDYGGSTITQQLIKNSILTPKKNFSRKTQELILATELEKRYSKNDILEMYLNTVYFGEGAYGIGQAAKTYFNKTPQQLTLAEASFLIGLLPSPSQLSPLTGDYTQAKIHQQLVLQKMLGQNYISPQQKAQAENEQLIFQPTETNLNTKAQHFAFLVMDQLIEKYGKANLMRSGFKIKTTLDPNWQDYTQSVVKNQVKKLAPNRVTNGAAVVIDPKTGEVKALVGSYDWADPNFGKVDVTTSLRQPGSSFKPIYYSAAFERQVITPTTILKDQPISYPNKPKPYTPKDYDGKFRGSVTARRALANSLNIPSVEVMHKLGIPQAVAKARQLGLTTISDENSYGLSLALGASEVKLLDMTGAYSAFANQGQKNDITTILEVRDKNGQIIYSYNPNPQQAVEPEAAFLISSILSDSLARREIFGNTLDISRPAAVKTGTTENYRDAWTLGYTPSLAVGAWVGNNDGTPMDNIAGSLGAAPIWKALMEKFLTGTTIENFSPPQGVVGLSICSYNGLIFKETATSGVVKEYFIKGTEPRGICRNPNPPTPTPTALPTSPTPQPSKS